MDDRVTGQPTDLPVEVTNLVGRRREITHLLRLLKTLRLVTMTGVGGSGKTRLALRVAERSRRNFARTGWVDLSGLTDDSLLEYQIAEALGIRDQSDRSVSEIVLAYLRERDLLLVLDNCEHLLDACATFVDRALPAAGGLRVLCTSRQPLGLIGEHIFTVLPLPVPDPDQPLHAVSGARYPGVALFVERAAAAAPGFTMTPRNRARIVELCRRLDGLPLAIELAAAQVHRLSVDAIDAELSDQFAGSSGEEPLGRHKALAATFDWSFELCTPAEQVLWARLSVFAGVFELAAAEHVCAGAQLAAEDIWEPLAGLVDKSVLIRDDNAGEARYRLLDTVRQYGLDRLRGVGGLNGVGEAGLRRRHRDWYLDLAERFHAGWFGPDQPAWNRRISAELANLRAALGHCLENPGHTPAAVRLAGALTYFWFACGAVHEGRYWLQRALSVDGPVNADRLRALAVYAWLLNTQGEHAAAVVAARECLDRARELDDPLLVARSAADLASGLFLSGDLAAARPLLDEAIEGLRDLPGAERYLVAAKVALAMVVLFAGDPARAAGILAECRALSRAHGERWWLGHTLAASAMTALTLGDVPTANGYAREGLRIGVDLNDPLGVAGALERLAWLAAAGQDHERAARLLGAADRQWRAIGQTMYGSAPLLAGHERCVASAREALGDAAYRTQFRRGAALTLDNAISYALRDPST